MEGERSSVADIYHRWINRSKNWLYQKESAFCRATSKSLIPLDALASKEEPWCWSQQNEALKVQYVNRNHRGQKSMSLQDVNTVLWGHPNPQKDGQKSMALSHQVMNTELGRPAGNEAALK